MSQAAMREFAQISQPLVVPVRNPLTGQTENYGLRGGMQAGKSNEAVPLNPGRIVDINQQLKARAGLSPAAQPSSARRSFGAHHERGFRHYRSLQEFHAMPAPRPTLGRAPAPLTRADLKNMFAASQPAVSRNSTRMPSSVTVPLADIPAPRRGMRNRNRDFHPQCG